MQAFNSLGGGSATLSVGKDRSRTKFRAFGEAVKKAQPTNLNMSFAEDVKNRAESDLQTQGDKARGDLSSMMPNTGSWLDDLTKGASGDAGARQRTMGNLQSFLPQYKPPNIDTAAEDDTLAFLNRPDNDAFMTLLAKERGGGVGGANALDAAVLGYTGVGNQLFEQGASKLRGMSARGDILEQGLRDARTQQEKDLEAAKQGIRGQAGTMASEIDAAIAKKIEDYKNRPVSDADFDEWLKMAENAAASPELKDEIRNLRIYHTPEYDIPKEILNQFTDRELTSAEAIGPDAERYNFLMDVIGKPQVLAQAPGSTRQNQGGFMEAINKLVEGRVAGKKKKSEETKAQAAAIQKSRDEQIKEIDNKIAEAEAAIKTIRQAKGTIHAYTQEQGRVARDKKLPPDPASQHLEKLIFDLKDERAKLRGGEGLHTVRPANPQGLDLRKHRVRA